MGQVLTLAIESFLGGVNTSLPPEMVPLGSSPRGRNCALTRVGTSASLLAKRPGWTEINATALTGVSAAPAIIGQSFFSRLATGTYTHYHLGFGDDGSLWTLAASPANLAAAATYEEDAVWQAITIGNIWYAVNGTDAIAYNGTTLRGIGITRPTVGTMAAAAGAAGLHNGTYELRVTYANADGMESSASDTALATVTVVDKQLSWSNIPTSADTSVTTRYLYARETATQTQFYRVGTIANNTATTATTNVLNANAIIKAPLTNDHEPCPAGTIALASYRGRMFAATPTDLYYTIQDQVEAFNLSNKEIVGRETGLPTTAMVVLKDALVVFKESAVYTLVGDDPATWTVRQQFNGIGCIAPNSIREIEGQLYWWSSIGPVRWDGEGAPVPIGQLQLATTVSGITQSSHLLIQAAVDYAGQRVLWTVPTAGASRNNSLLPWNYRVGCWESDGWDPMDFASIVEGLDSDDQWVVYGGSYAGQAFYQDADAQDDGGTASGTFDAAAASITAISDAGATFSDLVERKVSVIDSDGILVGRSSIASHTGTALTLSDAIIGLDVGATYDYIVGGPAFEWDTPWISFDGASPTVVFAKKRWEFVYLDLLSVDESLTTTLALSFDGAESFARTINVVLPSSGGGVFGTGVFGVSDFGGDLPVGTRGRIAKTGRRMRARISQYEAGGFTLVRMGFRAELLTEKS